MIDARHARADRRRRTRHRRRRREHEPGRALRAGRSLRRARAIRQPLWDRIARGPHHLRRQAPSGPGRHARDGGEPAPRVRDQPRGAGRTGLRSHARAVAAQQNGRFAEEIVPVPVKGRRRRQERRPSTSIRAPTPRWRCLAALRPVRLGIDPESTVTAGNASGQNDGAAACIVTTREKAEALGLRPLARLVSWAVAGVEPERMGIGPVPAAELALRRAGLGSQGHGPDRAQRGLRRAGAGLHRRLDVQAGATSSG